MLKRLLRDPRPAEGYLLMAFGSRHVELAESCAASITAFDPKRPIQLLVNPDAKISASLRKLVPYIDAIEPDNKFPFTLAKLRAFDLSRFQSTLFVDVDTLMLNNGIDEHWVRLQGYDFTIPGEKWTTGNWWAAQIPELLSLSRAPYIVKMNSGSIFFKRNFASKSVFNEAKRLMGVIGHLVGLHPTGAWGDEIFFGLAMGRHRMEPYPLYHSQIGTIMVSTINASDYVVSSDRLRITGYIKDGMPVAPKFVHFCGLNPPDLYNEMCQSYAGYLESKQ